MHIDAATLSAFLVAIVGGGGVVPFAWRSWTKSHPRSLETEKSKAEIESISQAAANETIEAMKGAMTVLRQQLLDGRTENEALRRELAGNRARIKVLEAKMEKLVAEIVRLGGTVDLGEPDLTGG